MSAMGIAGVLAVHDDPSGWFCDALDDLRYECNCGQRSAPLARDGTGIAEADCAAAAEWHRTHVADAIAAHLAEVVGGLREDGRTRVRQHDWDSEDGACECGATFRAPGDTDWWQHVADAVLAVVTEVLTGGVR